MREDNNNLFFLNGDDKPLYERPGRLDPDRNVPITRQSRVDVNVHYDETQKTFSQQFLPVNSNCFKANFEEDIYFTTGMTISNDKGEMLSYDWKNTDDDEESQLMAYIDSMDTPVMLDKKTMEVICDNCANYIDGSMTLDEAVKAVEDYTSIRSRE